MSLRIGSLFSGIGGLELGVEHVTGGRVVFQVERDGFCRDVLAKHWPDAVRYDDVCTVRGLPRVDILCGGFPCQDVSVAGKRAGFAGERSSLWREYRRIVADVGPRFVFVENVPGLLTADDGWAFGEVLGDLAALGFDATWDCFRASDVGAPHRRERIFLLAYRDDSKHDAVGNAKSGTRQRAPSRGGRHAALADQGESGRELALADRGGRGSDGLAGVGGSMGLRGGDPRDAAAPANAGSSGLADAIGGRRDGIAHGASRDILDGSTPRREEGADRVANGGQIGGVADPDVSRLEERRRVAGDGREELAPAERGSTRRESGRGALAGVGAVPDGVSRRLDDHQWPAGRGEAQHPGEPPRTAAGVVQRAAQLKAYGNAVVPAQAALAWRVLYARATGGAA